MAKIFEFPPQVSSDDIGYNCLIGLIKHSNTLFLDKLVLDFKNTRWFEANLLAVLGAILNQAQENLNDIEIKNMKPKLEKAFSKNHFLSNFSGSKIDDFYETSIKYKKFKAGEEKLFKVYLDNELLVKDAFPTMSVALKKKLMKASLKFLIMLLFTGNQNIFLVVVNIIQRNFG
jgi:hypothetical protein